MEQEADLPAFSDIFKSTPQTVILIGPANAGKTALVYRYVLDEVPDRIGATVALEFTKRNVEDRPGGAILQVHIWDTAGQERFKSITKHHYRGADACLAVFDASDRSSFEGLPGWLEELRENTDPECLLYVLGNKLDVERKVTREEAEAFTKLHSGSYFETSSTWARNKPMEGDKVRGGIESICALLVAELVQLHSSRDQGSRGAHLTTHFCAPQDKCLC
jgi:small GTP-binding protein